MSGQQGQPQAPAGQAAPASHPPGVVGATAAAGGAAAVGDLSFDDLNAVPVTKDPKAMVLQVANSAGYTVRDEGEQVHVSVPVGALRKQDVTVSFGTKDKEGQSLITYVSTCGPARPEIAVQLLKYNTRLIHGAFAVQDYGAGDMVVIQANELAETADPLDVSRILTSIAWQADRVEEKLLGEEDQH
jgi:hypothetical protein